MTPFQKKLITTIKDAEKKAEKQKDETFLALVKDSYLDIIEGRSSLNDIKDEVEMITTIRDNMKNKIESTTTFSEEEINRKKYIIDYVNDFEMKISKILNMKAFW